MEENHFGLIIEKGKGRIRGMLPELQITGKACNING
jgi:hypothetical protein